jgi:hypothetical protein
VCEGVSVHACEGVFVSESVSVWDNSCLTKWGDPFSRKNSYNKLHVCALVVLATCMYMCI